MKKINWLNIEKILWNEKKHFIVTIRNNYLKKKNDLKRSFDEEFKNVLKNQFFEAKNLLQKGNLNENLP